VNYPPRTLFKIQFADESRPDSAFSICAPLSAFDVHELIETHFRGASGFWTIYPNGARFYGDI
jgi:hypothetical protein